MTGHLLVIDWMGRPHTSNDERKKNHHELSRIHKAWRAAGAQACMIARPPIMARVKVTCWARYKTRVHTDPEGIAPALKCVLDGVVDRGVLVNDTSEFIAEVRFLPPVTGPSMPDALLVHLEEVLHDAVIYPA